MPHALPPAAPALPQLPKPKWVDRGLKAKTLFLSSPPGLWVRRCYLAAHGALILRCGDASSFRRGLHPLHPPCCRHLSLVVQAAAVLVAAAAASRQPLLYRHGRKQPGPPTAVPSCRPAASRRWAAPACCREVWRNLFAPGTFRGALRAAWRTLTTGQRFQWPQPCDASAAAAHLALAAAAASSAAADSDSWYITHRDLADFKATIDEGAAPAGATAWEPMMQKQWPGCTYTAWRRTLPSGKAEYKSVTISGAAGRAGARMGGRECGWVGGWVRPAGMCTLHLP